MKLTRRTFLKTGLSGAALVASGTLPKKWLSRCAAAAARARTSVAATVLPVAVPTASPKLLPTEIAKYSQYGYGKWQAGEGVAYQKRLDLMPTG